MVLQSVHVQVDVDCEWQGSPPYYRLWINDELFTERTWRWKDCYLEEEFVIHGPPGYYTIRYELVGDGKISTKNHKVLSGMAGFINSDTLRIGDAT